MSTQSTETLRRGRVVDALSLTLDHSRYPEAQTIAGTPSAAIRELCDIGQSRIGVWELTPGTVVDIEEDEVFIVLSGSAVIEFDETGDLLHLHPGSVVFLPAGAHTTWTVTETLRKVYVSPVG